MSGYNFESTFDGSLNQKQLRNAVYSEILMHLTSQLSNDDLSDRNEYVYNCFDVSSKESEYTSMKDRLYINIPANTPFKLNINCDVFNDNLLSEASIEYSDAIMAVF